jgi:glucose/arabinose dehydrogenase
MQIPSDQLLNPLRAAPASPEDFRRLPTPARARLDAADTWVPEGYDVEVVLAGLSFPCGLDVAEDGTIYLTEGGSTWPTRPYMPSRLIEFNPASGETRVLGVEGLGGLRGVTVRDGYVYAMSKGGYYSRLNRYDRESGERTTILDKMPDGGWHEPGGPLFGPDGLIYFAQGSIALQGVILPAGFTVDVVRHPHAFDIPGQDVTLTGNTVWTRDPRLPYPFLVPSSAYKPFGVKAEKGEKIEGELWCTTGVWRARPDGSDVELLAWGIRNPFGMAMNEQGELYISDNDYEEKTERAVGADPDRIWHVKSASLPHGSVQTPEWYGFPDVCGDGLPMWADEHRPIRGQAAEPMLQDPPPWAGPAAFLFEPHTGMAKMDFCRSDAFGHRGELFACLWGTMAPLNSIRPERLNNGFQVVRCNTKTGAVEPFFRNRQPGPASYHEGSGGLERPVDCKFAPDGRTLYVLDFGRSVLTQNLMVSYGHTGSLWKITRKEG